MVVKYTYNDIEKILKEFGYENIRTLVFEWEEWPDDYTEEEDFEAFSGKKLPLDLKCKISQGTWSYRDESYVILDFYELGIIVKIEGYYSSYDGTSFHSMYEVEAREITITDYIRKR